MSEEGVKLGGKTGGWTPSGVEFHQVHLRIIFDPVEFLEVDVPQLGSRTSLDFFI